jgi:hypothetical protein
VGAGVAVAKGGWSGSNAGEPPVGRRG